MDFMAIHHHNNAKHVQPIVLYVVQILYVLNAQILILYMSHLVYHLVQMDTIQIANMNVNNVIYPVLNVVNHLQVAHNAQMDISNRMIYVQIIVEVGFMEILHLKIVNLVILGVVHVQPHHMKIVNLVLEYIYYMKLHAYKYVHKDIMVKIIFVNHVIKVV